MHRIKRWLKRFWIAFRLLLIFGVVALFFDRDNDRIDSINVRVLAATRGHTFNFVEWELNALFSKVGQELFGFQPYIPEDERKTLLLDYLHRQRRVNELVWLMEITADEQQLDTMNTEFVTLKAELMQEQALMEHLIEGQVSAVLQEEGLTWWGQVVPPVTMRFLNAPDVLVVSPRNEIRQYMTVTLQPHTFQDRVALENYVASQVPEMSVWITPVGGVGIYPSMVQQVDQAVLAFEITAHEWVHHYLTFFPLGLEYMSHPDTRIINETTAALVGEEIGNKVIQRFYEDELEAGLVFLQPVPDYLTLLAALNGQIVSDPEINTVRALADYLLTVKQADAAQLVLDRQAEHALLSGQFPLADPNHPQPDADSLGWIHHTRVTVDYLLAIGNVEAAELVMDNGEKHSGLRVLNQAWFAFNAGYQGSPVVQQQPDGTTIITTAGGGGDPIGAAIYEIRARTDSLKEFLEIMRSITTREELFAVLENLRNSQER